MWLILYHIRLISHVDIFRIHMVVLHMCSVEYIWGDGMDSCWKHYCHRLAPNDSSSLSELKRFCYTNQTSQKWLRTLRFSTQSDTAVISVVLWWSNDLSLKQERITWQYTSDSLILLYICINEYPRERRINGEISLGACLQAGFWFRGN